MSWIFGSIDFVASHLEHLSQILWILRDEVARLESEMHAMAVELDFRRNMHRCEWCDAYFQLNAPGGEPEDNLNAAGMADVAAAEPSESEASVDDGVEVPPDPGSPEMSEELAGLLDWLANADPTVFVADME